MSPRTPPTFPLATTPSKQETAKLTPPAATSSTLIQFKPKWLAPSPSAPPNSKRCRTCALHARRALPTPSFCPLDLISPSPPDVRRAAALLLGLPASTATASTITTDPTATTTIQNGTSTSAHNSTQNGGQNGTVPATATPKQLETLTRVTHWALTSPLLRHLRSLQISCDPHGVSHVTSHGGETERRGLQIAMTLRDVTVFLVVPDGKGELRARLGDLDVKSLGKVREWEEAERGLGGGWYQGGGEGCWLGKEGGEGGKKKGRKERGRCIGQ